MMPYVRSGMADHPARPELHVNSAPGGWPHPWQNVAEIAELLPVEAWTLVGGLMTQLHVIHRGLNVLRPTDDVDVVLHIETSRGVPSRAAQALEQLGYRLQAKVDPRDNTAHRWVRGGQAVDIAGGEDPDDHVDVLTADHAAPRVREQMRGRDMVPIEGGTQALRRTMNAAIEIQPGTTTTISVPRPFGAVILKSAAYTADSRDRDRHLSDAAALLACIEDPFSELSQIAGSDRRRIQTLIDRLPANHPAWLPLDPAARRDAQAALRVLAGG